MTVCSNFTHFLLPWSNIPLLFELASGLGKSQNYIRGFWSLDKELVCKRANGRNGRQLSILRDNCEHLNRILSISNMADKNDVSNFDAEKVCIGFKVSFSQC